MWNSFRDSAQQVHLNRYDNTTFFHSMRIRQEIDDGMLWGQGDSTLEQKILRPKPQSDFATSRARFGSSAYGNQFTSSGIQPNSGRLNQFNQHLPTCYRWNAGSECYEPGCKFRHACGTCSGNHRARDCRTSNPGANDRQLGSNPGATLSQGPSQPPDARR